jgi:hypothetical protein
MSLPFSKLLTVLGLSLVTFTALSPIAKSAQITVPATSNIFGAGRAIAPDPGGGGGGTLPPVISVNAAPGQFFVFPEITGSVSLGGPAVNGPDGGPFASGNTNIFSLNGISGIVNDEATMFLVGVFLDDNLPDLPTPARLDFTMFTNFSELAPSLRQTFFIGDGLTGTGTGSLQRFIIPNSATRLFLGFADALEFGNPISPPGYYDDNAGFLNVEYKIIPTPALLPGLIGMGVAAWRKRKQEADLKET